MVAPSTVRCGVTPFNVVLFPVSTRVPVPVRPPRRSTSPDAVRVNPALATVALAMTKRSPRATSPARTGSAAAPAAISTLSLAVGTPPPDQLASRLQSLPDTPSQRRSATNTRTWALEVPVAPVRP